MWWHSKDVSVVHHPGASFLCKGSLLSDTAAYNLSTQVLHQVSRLPTGDACIQGPGAERVLCSAARPS